MNRALLVYSNTLFYSTSPSNESPETAVTRLIEGIWDHFPDQAFHLLRARIITDYPLTSICKASVKLAAKRAKSLPTSDFDSLMKSGLTLKEIIPTEKPIQSILLPGSQLSIAGWMRSYPFGGDRPIIAVLCDQNQKPVLAKINTSSKNRLLHAEVNLVRAYVSQYKQKIPSGYQIWVSLKPCCMCGSFLGTWSEEANAIEVIYLENDPGPKARTSPLTNQHIYT